jgi:hypothetical protein
MGPVPKDGRANANLRTRRKPLITKELRPAETAFEQLVKAVNSIRYGLVPVSIHKHGCYTRIRHLSICDWAGPDGVVSETRRDI